MRASWSMSNSFQPPRFPTSRNHDKIHRNIPKIGNRVRSHWRLVRSGLENDTSLTVCHIPRLDSSQARIEMPHYLGLRSRLFGIHDLVSHLRRYGLQALVAAPPPVRPSGPRCTSATLNQLTSLHAGFGRVRCRWAPHHHPVAGGSWFVGHSCGTREKWLFVLPGATNRAMSALSGGFRVHNAACGMCDLYPTISRL